MKNYIYFIFSALVILLSSCMSEEFTLEKSVFIEDQMNPGLPEYSEWGYNTFGVYIDRIPFISTNQELPAKIIVNTDTLNLIIKGNYNNEPTTLKFRIIGYPLSDYPELIALNDKTINLKDDNVQITLISSNDTVNLQIIEGSFTVKRAQNLYVDKELTKAILSGIFSFKTFLSGEPIAVSNGRFDFGIGYGNFYNY